MSLVHNIKMYPENKDNSTSNVIMLGDVLVYIDSGGFIYQIMKTEVYNIHKLQQYTVTAQC